MTTTYRVHVFKEDPRWDHIDRWWAADPAFLRETRVATYEFPVGEDDPDPTYWLYRVEEEHPDCVVVG